MSFCTRCGARIPDGAAFCTNCGAPVQGAQPPVSARTSDDGRGIVIDAPADATVVISNPEGSSMAPETEGEFVAASWSAPVKPKPAPAPTQQPYQQPVYQQPAYQQPAYQQPKKKVGFWKFLLGVVISFALIALLIFISGVIQGLKS